MYKNINNFCCSMEGGELFDRIQKKGHFTERGKAVWRNIQHVHVHVCE